MTSTAPLVLVVDDDPGILGALRALFESEGYRVQTCEKGDYVEGLRDETGALPDVIVLDVLLSGKDGRAICRALKEHVATRHVPVVMISAHPGAEQSVKEVGADAFVAKPFAIDDLLDTIERLLAARADG
jgi:CheY-like chemotaxis protein